MLMILSCCIFFKQKLKRIFNNKKDTIDNEPKVIRKVQQGKVNPLRIEILRYFAQDRTAW